MREILNGMIDMHIHGGPSVAKRRDTGEFMVEMGKAGYKGFVLKDHYMPSAGSVILLNKQYHETTKVTAFSSVILNNSVGGLNLYALDMAYNMGTKVASFPTISAKHHIDTLTGPFLGAGSMKCKEGDKPIYVLDENGDLKREAMDVVDFIATRPDMILWTGHLGAEEVDKVIQAAVAKGVRKILANHPHWLVGATYDQMKKWAGMGVYIEVNMTVIKGWADGDLFVTPAVLSEMFKILPVHQIVLDTDLGQLKNPPPVEGMYTYIQFLMKEFGLTKQHINIMAKENPAKLLDLT